MLKRCFQQVKLESDQGMGSISLVDLTLRACANFTMLRRLTLRSPRSTGVSAV
jgi:hypothetical protein